MSNFSATSLRKKQVERLRAWMAVHKVTQVQLADMLGVQQATVSSWLVGNRLPNFNRYFVIEKFLQESNSN